MGRYTAVWFCKKRDPHFLLQYLSGTGYEHKIDLALSENILKDFKDKKISWPEYEVHYLELLGARHIADKLNPDEIADTCLLCAEKTLHHCHRRLLTEYLQREGRIAMEVIHL